ncbi:hypothetical protein [Chondrinema litorale]|uniref:hypothetical protein n=1 Tax=Chondrinema litorale TaxID=2994555 RepID=UPI002543041C|nr:hypothetical protein [Chondrinema litorale]UZR95725.1 hypothetical protein OQ292_07860 [Chondrinema litorale]
MAKVFLGGVGNESSWREQIIPNLTIGYVDPLQEDNTHQKQSGYAPLSKPRVSVNNAMYTSANAAANTCDFLLYVITPLMQGFYLIPALIEDSNKKPEKTLFCAVFEENHKLFTPHQKKSLEATGKMVERNGGRWLKSLDEVVNFLNSYQ